MPRNSGAPRVDPAPGWIFKAPAGCRGTVNRSHGVLVNAKSFTARNRTLLIILAATGIFVGGCLTGYRLSRLYALWSATRCPRIPQMAIVDGDGSEIASRLKSELQSAASLEVSEYPDRAAAQKDLAASKIDIVVCIGPDFKRRVERLDLADIFESPRGRLDGKLENLDIEVETRDRLAGASETVETLIYSVAVRSISAQILERAEPALARKFKTKLMRRQPAADESR